MDLFSYINLPLEQHSMSEFLKQKKRMRKTIVTKKAVRYLTYMRQSDENVTNLRVKFSDNLPPTKAKREDGYTFLHGRNKNVIHTCKFKHRLNETTSSIYGSQMRQTPQKKKMIWFQKGASTFCSVCLDQYYVGLLCQLVFYHYTSYSELFNRICHLGCLSKVNVIIKLFRHINCVFTPRKY